MVVYVVKEDRRLGLFATPYSFFLYLLKFGYDNEDILIFTHAFPQNICKNLNPMQVIFMNGQRLAPFNSFKGIFTNIIGVLKHLYGYIKLRFILFFKNKKYNIINYGHAHTPFSFMFYENENSYIIEDGLLNYIPDIQETHKINPIIDKFLHFCGIYSLSIKESLGSHKNIKKVYLTHENNHPLIKDKVEILDIEKLWEDKSDEEKKEILKIFNIDMEKLSEFDDDCVLLLTQPLSEDNKNENKNISYEEEISIYNNIIEKFSGMKIILKPHPREKKNYSKIFPDIEIMDRSFPIELLHLTGFKPKIVASVVSTAVLNFLDSDIYVYNQETTSEYINSSIDNIKKLLKENDKQIMQ